jgi:hypothetical protein
MKEEYRKDCEAAPAEQLLSSTCIISAGRSSSRTPGVLQVPWPLVSGGCVGCTTDPAKFAWPAMCGLSNCDTCSRPLAKGQ